MRRVQATRYVTALREGGSVPAILEADDQGLYVTKFRGAAQGVGALIAEALGGALAQAAGLRVPERVLVEFDLALARNEPDPEIRDLLKGSGGLNVGLDYLPGSVTFDPLAKPAPEPGVASDVVLFDALIANVDRTAKNPNLLVWHKALWLIDHGSAFYFHHDWEHALEKSRAGFPMIGQHVLLPYASELGRAGERLERALDERVLDEAVAVLPDAWLGSDPFASPAAHRDAYRQLLKARFGVLPAIVEEALRAHAQLV